MYKIKNPGNRLWFSADFHAFHKREFIWRARGFGSPEAHANALITLVNASVGPNDTLFHLGDLTLNCDATQLRDWMSRIRCRNVVCLWGNHASPLRSLLHTELGASLPAPENLPFAVHAVEPLPYRYKSIPNLVVLGDTALLEIDNDRVFLSHYAHQSWEDAHKGAYHLCGHNHGRNPYSHPDTGDRRVLDVGVDIGWKLWNWRDVLALLTPRPFGDPTPPEASDDGASD